MLVIYVLSFQGPNGGVTFPMVGVSLTWFDDVFKPGQMANIPVSFSRSIAARRRRQRADGGVLGRRRAGVPPALSGLRRAVLLRRRQPRDAQPAGRLRHRPRLPGARAGRPSLFTSALGAQLTWTLPFGLFAMFAVVNRFNRSYEEAANDLGANAWQRLRYVTLPILLPGIIGVAMGAFTLSYDEYARTTLAIGRNNTLPLEIYALISSATSPMLFAIGTLTTSVSFLIIGVTLLVVLRMQRRRAADSTRSG